MRVVVGPSPRWPPAVVVTPLANPQTHPIKQGVTKQHKQNRTEAVMYSRLYPLDDNTRYNDTERVEGTDPVHAIVLLTSGDKKIQVI